MTVFVFAYAAIAYWLFWGSLRLRPGETAGVVVMRAALFLVAGPLLIAPIAIAGLAVDALSRLEVGSPGRRKP